MSWASLRIREALRRSMAAVAIVALLASPLRFDVSAQEIGLGIAEAAPASTVALLWFDLDREGSQWQQADELLARIGLPDALDTWEESILDQGEESGGITASELDALLGGDMAVVVLPPAVERMSRFLEAVGSGDMMGERDAAPPVQASDEASGIVTLLRPSDLDTSWDYVERQFAELAGELGVQVEEHEFGDADILVIPPGPLPDGMAMHDETGHAAMDHWMDHHGMGGQRGLAAARAGEFIVAGRSEADLTGVLEVIAGDADSLAESQDAQAVLAKLPAEALALSYVNGQQVLDALDPETIAKLQGVMQGTPVEVLGSQAGMAVSAEPSGFRFDSVTILNDAVDPSSFMVQNDPAVAAAAERAPSDTFAFRAGLLPANAFMGAAYSVAQAVNSATSGEAGREAPLGAMELPTEEEMMQEIATASASLGFDLQADLFDLLGDEFLSFTTLPSISRDGFNVDAVAAISTNDPDELAESMARFGAWLERSAIGFDVSVRDVEGTLVLVATDQDAQGVPAVEFGVVENLAVFGLGGGIDALMNEPVDSLADDEQYQAVMALLPDAYYQVGYVDLGQIVDPIMNVKGGMQALQALQSGSADALMTPSESGSLRNIRAVGAVAFQEDQVSGASAILYIAGES